MARNKSYQEMTKRERERFDERVREGLREYKENFDALHTTHGYVWVKYRKQKENV